jgi:hypothetical protein
MTHLNGITPVSALHSSTLRLLNPFLFQLAIGFQQFILYFLIQLSQLPDLLFLLLSLPVFLVDFVVLCLATVSFGNVVHHLLEILFADFVLY